MGKRAGAANERPTTAYLAVNNATNCAKVIVVQWVSLAQGSAPAGALSFMTVPLGFFT